MKKELKPRRNIERATKFKVQYALCNGEAREIQEREFANLKSLRQWIDRNEQLFDVLIIKTLGLIRDEWEPFTTIGKKTISLSDLESIVRDLHEEYKPSKNKK